MPPRQAPPASPLTRVPELDDPRSPSVPAHLATIYEELAEARQDFPTICECCSAGIPSAAPYLWKLSKQIDKRERLSELECENEILKCQNENLKKELAAAKRQLETSRLEEAGEYERAEAFDDMAEARLADRPHFFGSISYTPKKTAGFFAFEIQKKQLAFRICVL
jgi:hypothetical protein